MNMLKRLPSCLSISLLTLAMNSPAGAQQSADPGPQPKQTEDEIPRSPDDQQSDADPTKNLEEIIVTGSLIPREANTDISPVTVVTSEDMADKGPVQ